jgi:hypothetical protein
MYRSVLPSKVTQSADYEIAPTSAGRRRLCEPRLLSVLRLEGLSMPASGRSGRETRWSSSKLNTDIQDVLDKQTEVWGIKVSNVEIKRIDLNESMMDAPANATRKIITSLRPAPMRTVPISP